MGQIVKNGAVADGSGQVAFAAKLDEFGFQGRQRRHLFLDALDMMIEEIVDFVVFLCRLCLQRKQRADLSQRHLKGPAVSDELQPLEMLCAIGAIA